MGDMARWLAENWFNLFSSLGIIGGLWFTAVSLHSETKTRRVANLLTITASHREMWKQFFQFPALARVVDPSADVATNPITPAEELFVGLVISHLNSVFYASTDELVVKWEGVKRDVGQFFSLPIPKAVWQRTRTLQNQDFAAFIDASLK
jgi:hypothetical protein